MVKADGSCPNPGSRPIPGSRPKARVVAAIVVACLAVAAAALLGLARYKVIPVNQLFLGPDAVGGVDVSAYQGRSDMGRLAEQGVQFVYMKATEGSGFVDARFRENWEAAAEAGLPAGAYHFFSFESPGATQAANYIQTVGDLDGALVPAVDVEWYGPYWNERPKKADAVRELGALLDSLEERYGVRPLLYAHREVYEALLADDFADYPLWVSNTAYPAWFDGWDDWTVWQYFDRGELEGYEGGDHRIDLDVLGPGKSLEDLAVVAPGR